MRIPEYLYFYSQTKEFRIWINQTTRTGTISNINAQEFSNMKISRLENIEKLEQLRILENRYSIQVVETKQNSIGVDRPSDVEKIIKNIVEKK